MRAKAVIFGLPVCFQVRECQGMSWKSQGILDRNFTSVKLRKVYCHRQ